MNHSKAVYVALKDMKGNRGYVCKNDINNNKRDYLEGGCVIYKDFSCQYDSNSDNKLCTCKNTNSRKETGYYSTTRQVYRYTNSEGYTDIGIGKIKIVPRRRIRRIYLPDTEDRGVGSADLSSFIARTWNKGIYSSYEQKKTLSKCVGGKMEFNEVSILSKKFSPISKIKSGFSSHSQYKEKEDLSFNNSKTEKDCTTIQAHYTHIEKPNQVASQSNIKQVEVGDTKNFSSYSFIEHVHNLETPSLLEQSNELLEKKLERSIKVIPPESKNFNKPKIEVKPVQDYKNTSIRKRFEALKNSFHKKFSKENCKIENSSSSSHDNAIKKDVSITSDPPSLEARSFTNMKKHSPIHLFEEVLPTTNREPANDVGDSSHWSTVVMEGECQNAKDMFKLWGEKFKLDEDNFKKTSSVIVVDTPKKQKKKVELVIPKEEPVENEKKEKKRFSFFRRKEKKNKDKSKETYKSKKGVTAGRCEVGNGLQIKVGTLNTNPPSMKTKHIPGMYDDLVRNNWLKRCLDTRSDSRESLRIRWKRNNDMYATSSSTIFELMECLYKNTGITFRSKSEMTSTTVPSSSAGDNRGHYRYYRKPQVNFMQQTLQAWMIPSIITDNNIVRSMEQRNSKYKHEENIAVTYSNKKCYIDKSKAFSQRIKLILNAKNIVEDDRVERSKYIVLDIPRGYFSGTSSENEEQTQMSNEQVYNIVEYETVKSCSYVKIKSNDSNMNIGHHKSSNICLTNVEGIKDTESRVIETVGNTSSLHRDVVVQGSNVYVPNHCDVIGVGVITQLPHNRDVPDIRNTMLKIQKDTNVNKSSKTIAIQKKCDLAESYIQDCYRRWIPLDVDLYSWCISNPNFGGSSDNISQNSHRDYSKSCPNIYDEYRTSTIISSYDTSSSSHYKVFRDTRKSDDATTTYFNKLKKNSGDLQESGKRIMPKDSVEVFKRRKIYAASKNANWCNSCLDTEISGSRVEAKCLKIKDYDPNQNSKKRVLVKDFNETKRVGDGILSFKGSSGKCSIKQATVNSEPIDIPEPPCLDSCIQDISSYCEKKDSEVAPVCLSRNTLPPNSRPPSLPTCPPQKSPTPKTSFKKDKITPCPKLCIPPSIHGNPLSSTPNLKKNSMSSPPSSYGCIRRIKSSLSQQKPIATRKSSPTPSTLPCGCNKQQSCGTSKCLSRLNLSGSSKKTPPKSYETTPKSSVSGKGYSCECVINKHSDVCMSDDCMKNTTGSAKALSTASPKEAGVHLSKKPLPHISSPLNEPSCNVISLDSNDNGFLRNKPLIPNSIVTTTSQNIKVQDEDGNTLYERHEYRMNESENKNSIVSNMYRDSRIHRVSTSKTELVLKDKNLEICTSNSSLSNVVEINFNLKLKQADKNTKVNMTKNITKDMQNENKKNQENLKSVYIFEDKKNDANDDIVDLENKDVNIKIVINSYKQKPDDSNHKIKNSYVSTKDKFTSNISNNFNTVSTAYSDVIDPLTYSIHRTTLNYSDSTETYNNQVEPCKELVNEIQPEKSPRNFSDTSTVHNTFDQSLSENNSKNLNSKEILSDNSINIATSGTDKEDVQAFSGVKHSNMEISKIRDKDQKKMILKQIFESKNDSKFPTKNLPGIRKLLRAVFSSDSSVYADVVKKLSLQSLISDNHKESDSVKNDCGNSLSESKTSKNKRVLPKLAFISTNTSELNDNKKLQCLCHLSTLNIQENTCCCGRIDIKDEEIDCDLIQDILTLNKPKYVDVETQDTMEKHQKSVETITSYVEVMKPQVKNRKFGKMFDKFPKKRLISSSKACAKKISRQTELGLSNDSKVTILNSEPRTFEDDITKNNNTLTPIDILQLPETKKAVLDIYTERSNFDARHFVARLPRFVYNKESQICNRYQEILRNMNLGMVQISDHYPFCNSFVTL